MPIYKQDQSGKFVPFEQTPFPDLEKVLEDWIEENPHLLLEEETIAIFARQPRTAYDKYLDLLGVDATGATVVIELKRGETPRDVVAQTLEYAAWVDSLSREQLDELARNYAANHSAEVEGLADLYSKTFEQQLEETGEDQSRATERVTFNNRQRLVIVAERFSGEVEQTLRYLRTRFGADVYGVEFSVHRAGGDILISTETIVGREPVTKPSQPAAPKERESDEYILAKVRTEFLRRAVTAIETWVDGLNTPGLVILHSSGSDHYLQYLGVTWLYYYYALSWMYMSLSSASDDEVELLRTRLSKPESFQRPSEGGNWRFHVVTDDDSELVKGIIASRLEARKQPVAAS